MRPCRAFCIVLFSICVDDQTKTGEETPFASLRGSPRNSHPEFSLISTADFSRTTHSKNLKILAYTIWNLGYPTVFMKFLCLTLGGLLRPFLVRHQKAYKAPRIKNKSERNCALIILWWKYPGNCVEFFSKKKFRKIFTANLIRKNQFFWHFFIFDVKLNWFR